jgi:hypothetical protein
VKLGVSLGGNCIQVRDRSRWTLTATHLPGAAASSKGHKKVAAPVDGGRSVMLQRAAPTLYSTPVGTVVGLTGYVLPNSLKYRTPVEGPVVWSE